jgi:hypothetical protein
MKELGAPADLAAHSDAAYILEAHILMTNTGCATQKALRNTASGFGRYTAAIFVTASSVICG